MSVVESREDQLGAEAGPQAPRGADVDRLLRAALEEDLGSGDVTRFAVPAASRARGHLLAKERARVSGLPAFARVFELLDPGFEIRFRARDGETVLPGDVLVELEGPARALLAGERTALNLVQRLSGIATLTAAHVAAAGGAARVLDTRKTTPGLRVLEKYAVRCGGGENHRRGLFDEVMVKNNHVDLAGVGLAELVRGLRERHGPAMRITAEARDETEARAAVAGGADVVLLDNLPPDELRRLCALLRTIPGGREVELEASGGITLDTIAEVAATGVDRVSVGALTHSAPAVDLSLRLEVPA